jgi:hypothetical protein
MIQGVLFSNKKSDLTLTVGTPEKYTEGSRLMRISLMRISLLYPFIIKII